MLEPAFNNRSIIIKNYYEDDYPTNVKGIKLPLKNSKGSNYEHKSDDGKFTYDFDIKFKETILSEDWTDGYDFWWKEPDENDRKKDKNNCLKYFVEILDSHENQIISMTVTKNPCVSNEQIHFYIKKNLITQIRSFINRGFQYSNISLLIHSYASWLFDANVVYSFLLSGMRKIFLKNNINVEIVDDSNVMNALFCIRGILEKIIITEEFKKLWFGDYNYKELSNNPFIKIYKLESKIDSVNLTTSGSSTNPNPNPNHNNKSSTLHKYLKYKQKYLQLKNKHLIN
jgi:hypothetical protein